MLVNCCYYSALYTVSHTVSHTVYLFDHIVGIKQQPVK